VGIDGEPAQTTQMSTTMIATAFVTDDLSEILEAGLAAVDPRSEIQTIVDDVRRWHREHPRDWRTTRRLIKEKYSRYGGRTRDGNGYELNTACTVAALLYGEGDFQRTVMIAFNLGWDCDNNAATAATIIGVIRGSDWMKTQGWEIKDRYRNTTREGMPDDETITSYGDRLVELADTVIRERGGEKTDRGGQAVYRIRRQQPSVVEEFLDPAEDTTQLKADLEPGIRDALAGADRLRQARAAYLAICLDLYEDLQREVPELWSRAVDALAEHPKVVQVLFHQSPTPRGEQLRERAVAAGLDRPAKPEPVWTMDLDPRGSDLASDTSPPCFRLRSFATYAKVGRQDGDIDALIESSYWLDRVASEFAESCGELVAISESIGRHIESGGWDDVAREASSIRRLVDELHPAGGDGTDDEDPLCEPVVAQIAAVEAAVGRRDIGQAIAVSENLALASRELTRSWTRACTSGEAGGHSDEEHEDVEQGRPSHLSTDARVRIGGMRGPAEITAEHRPDLRG
jgi:hypothetical protein